MKFLLVFARYEDEWQKVDKSAKLVDNRLKLCKRYLGTHIPQFAFAFLAKSLGGRFYKVELIYSSAI
jgi:hypothetical protein